MKSIMMASLFAVLAVFLFAAAEPEVGADAHSVTVAPAAPAVKSGVEGRAVQYPVFGNAPTFPVPPTYPAGVEIVAKDVATGKEVARVKTDKDGAFKLDLPAGKYRLEGNNGPNFRCSVDVTVKPGEWVKLKPGAVFRYVGPPIPAPPPHRP
ncbi:MAG: hypothetical protein K2W95_25185 [Candidatus Obscuribacterales bacterium]|nr:hypothetical protein [Candidatus Obscuribacterales bacterium]